MKPSHPYRFLLADDDRAFRETLGEVLEPHFRVLEADSGERALELARDEDVDIALLDVHMPALSGVETARRLKQVHADAPCLLMTARPTLEIRQHARLARVEALLVKPFPKRDLLHTVARALRHAYHQTPFDGDD